MFPPLLAVFPDVNFPVVDLLDHVIVDELVNDFTLLGLHLYLGYPARLRHPVERRRRLGLCPQVGCRLVEGHDDTVLRVHVEEAHPVANLEAVEAALLDNAYIEAVACRIHHCGPYTAAGGGTRHQNRVNVHLVEVPDERGPKETTGPTLRNDEILGLGTNLLDNRVTNMLMF